MLEKRHVFYFCSHPQRHPAGLYKSSLYSYYTIQSYSVSFALMWKIFHQSNFEQCMTSFPFPPLDTAKGFTLKLYQRLLKVMSYHPAHEWILVIMMTLSKYFGICSVFGTFFCLCTWRRSTSRPCRPLPCFK